jgi:regulator of RNase E activity RraB
LAILPSLGDALLAQEANTEAKKMGKAKKAKVDAAKTGNVVAQAENPTQQKCGGLS